LCLAYIIYKECSGIKRLTGFYESNDMGEIKQFLYENCIDGIAFEPLPGQEQEEEPER
jgi:hypothetical protein